MKTGALSVAGTLDANSTTKPMLPPRMTTTQMNAVASPTAGMVIFNTTAGSLYQYTGSAWAAVGGSGSIGTLPAGLSRAATGLSGNGSYYTDYAAYAYLCIGKDSNGVLQMTNGVAAGGTQIPLPTGCVQADCCWIVSPMAITGVPAAMSGWECYVDTNRYVYVRCRSNNWVS